MSTMNAEWREKVLLAFSEISAIAENEEAYQDGLEDFLVMREYSRLREPERFLILGGRGAGKTKLFCTLKKPHGFEKIIGDQTQILGPRADNTDIAVGYEISRNFSSQDVLDNYAEDKKARAYWAGSLLIVLLDMPVLGSALKEIMAKQMTNEWIEVFAQKNALKSITSWIGYIQDNSELWESILDQFDEYLEKNDRWVFVAYDSLDRLTTEYTQLFPYIRALLSFWFTQSNRWQRLRCKIFLRLDLYDSDLLTFMDSSKINGNNKIILEWTTLSLYRLLLKRVANPNRRITNSEDYAEAARQYLDLIPDLINEDRDPLLGYVPTDKQKSVIAFIEQLIGQYMGNSPKKGLSYSWVPNHLQDAKGILAPRSFLKCFSVAAKKMLDRKDELEKMQDNRLILPSMIQDALVDVSDDRVNELQEEYPWLEQLRSAFKDLNMLMDKAAFIEKIDMNLWHDKLRSSLPAPTPQGIFTVLTRLGIIFIANDGRVNVPEIYLHGFRMKRKGGLRRSTKY